MKTQKPKTKGTREKNPFAISYRMKCKRTANGLSHYVPNEKKSLV